MQRWINKVNVERERGKGEEEGEGKGEKTEKEDGDGDGDREVTDDKAKRDGETDGDADDLCDNGDGDRQWVRRRRNEDATLREAPAHTTDASIARRGRERRAPDSIITRCASC